jgi:23S rRNA pseudouridine2605 synthase
MKKNTSAKKGFSPFKENKSSSNKKAAKPNNGAYRPRKTKSEDGAATERPEKGEWKRPERPEREKTDRKFGEKAPRADGKFWDKSDRKRTEARPERGDSERKDRPKTERSNKPSKFADRPERNSFGGEKTERKSFGDKPERGERKSFGGERTERKSFGDKPERGERTERKSFGGERTERKSFGDKPERGERTERKSFGDRPERGERKSFGDKSERAEKPARGEGERRPRISNKTEKRTANGRTPFKPRPKTDDDSAFHSPGGTRSKDTREERSTPSGFNRKKFFDTANDRFADKQERKTDARKSRRDDDAEERRPRREDSSREFGKHRPRKGEGEDTEYAPGEMPLNKYIAHSGLCSRRKAVDYVKEGKVTVNGIVITEPATKITPKDEVAISNKRINIQKNLVYILLNKPKGYITTTDDPEGRKTVMELVQDATTDERVYPVGRLDRNTSGLLLLTNDGELAQKLAHPKHNIRKIYHVGLDKPLTKADFDQIVAGVTLEDGVAVVDALGYVETNDRKEVGIEIHSGKNRIVRRIFEHLEYQVEKLDRVTYAGLTKKNVNRGKWRFLTEKEVILLKHFK